jgi:hypothetical protein
MLSQIISIYIPMHVRMHRNEAAAVDENSE